MGIFDRLFKKAEPAPETPAVPPVVPPAAAELPAPPSATPVVPPVPPAAPPVSQPPAQTVAVAPPPAEPETKGGWFSRLKSGLSKTARILNTDIRDLFKKEGQLLDDDFLERLFAILVRTDMGAGPANSIRERLRSKFRGRVLHMSDLLAEVKEELLKVMKRDEVPLAFAESGPTVILVVGVNGSGKTTSIAKLTRLLASQGKKVVLGAGDTFRAAAVEQLTIWSQRLGVEIVTGAAGSDPASVAYRAVAAALEKQADICIIDTAGRLQTQANLMQELGKIRKVIEKQIPAAPHEVLLVLDATAGQNGISQAKGFSEAVQCTGIILAKIDGTAKGGVVIPILQQFEIPVKFIGVGEKPEDLAKFNAQEFVRALLDEEEEK